MMVSTFEMRRGTWTYTKLDRQHAKAGHHGPQSLAPTTHFHPPAHPATPCYTITHQSPTNHSSTRCPPAARARPVDAQRPRSRSHGKGQAGPEENPASTCTQVGRAPTCCGGHLPPSLIFLHPHWPCFIKVHMDAPPVLGPPVYGLEGPPPMPSGPMPPMPPGPMPPGPMGMPMYFEWGNWKGMDFLFKGLTVPALLLTACCPHAHVLLLRTTATCISYCATTILGSPPPPHPVAPVIPAELRQWKDNSARHCARVLSVHSSLGCWCMT